MTDRMVSHWFNSTTIFTAALKPSAVLLLTLYDSVAFCKEKKKTKNIHRTDIIP